MLPLKLRKTLRNLLVRKQPKGPERKQRRTQVTCYCHSYAFPHRIGGGRCTGALWAASYLEVDGAQCARCNARCAPNTCEVARGTEEIQVCEGYQEHLLHTPALRLPTSAEALLADRYHTRGSDLSDDDVPF
jgi:hypothetical protein